MATPPEVRDAILRHQSSVRQVREQVERHARMQWGALESYRDADIERVVTAVTPVALGSQQRVAALTDAYMAAVATASGMPQQPMGIPSDEVTGRALRGVDPREVYSRAGPTVWTALSDGHALSAAAAMGLDRLLSMLMTDIQLAKTRSAQWRSSRDESVVGYRRVLTGSENCSLCTVASTQRYHRGDLLPIHPGCDCDIAEIRGDVDPGQVIDPDRLEDLHQRVRDEFGMADRGGREIDYRDILVRDHGEYGPTLTWRGQRFTGPDDI